MQKETTSDLLVFLLTGMGKGVFIMEIKRICQSQWNDVKNIYMEAFPKSERKPFFFLKRAVQKGKSEIWVASQSDVVAGFIVLIPYHDMVLV